MSSRSHFCFFFIATETTEIYTLSLHDALPIFNGATPSGWNRGGDGIGRRARSAFTRCTLAHGDAGPTKETANLARSEEHTSELQSHSDLVCRLLLEKKKITPSKKR